MTNKGNMTSEDLQIQGLLAGYLQKQSKSSNSNKKQHLDDDLLSAFVEGNLNLREQKTVVSHLVDCSFCRHVTAELAKLEMEFEHKGVIICESENQPTKVSEVLSNILSRVFGTSDGAVFAHQEPDREEETKIEEK